MAIRSTLITYLRIRNKNVENTVNMKGAEDMDDAENREIARSRFVMPILH